MPNNTRPSSMRIAFKTLALLSYTSCTLLAGSQSFAALEPLERTTTTTAILPTTYDDLAGHKAQVIFTATPHLPYTSHGQQNKLAASTFAHKSCLTEHPPRADIAQGYCELTRLDDDFITTAAQIKAKISKERHPLFLWRYQRGSTTVYLGGSIHILKAGLHPLPAQFQQAFDATEKLVLEVDLSRYTPQELQFKTMQYALLAKGQQLPAVLQQDTYAALSSATAEYGLSLAQMSQFKPGFITQQLAVLALMAVGYNPAEGMENHFTTQADDKEILQLETLDFQLDLLMNQPLATQEEMTRDMLGQMDSFEPYTAELVGAWLAGDDAAFKAAFDAQSGTTEAIRAFMFNLLDKRNQGMAKKIAEYLRGEGQYLVLIGAAHYVGEGSIIKLLEKMGFIGQRIFSDQNINQ